MASRTAIIPLNPTRATTTISASGIIALVKASSPKKNSVWQKSSIFSIEDKVATAGLNSLTCSFNKLRLLPADNDTILNLSGLRRTTFNVCTPIEPVLPSSAIFFILTYLQKHKGNQHDC